MQESAEKDIRPRVPLIKLIARALMIGLQVKRGHPRFLRARTWVVLPLWFLEPSWTQD